MTAAGRRARERALLAIIDERSIGTQAELVRALAAEGHRVTQATVSRDIRRLGIVKLRTNGGSRYARPELETPAPVARRVLETALREFALDVDAGDALVSIRTQSGCANAVAVAIDESELYGVVATLAGDDTILVLCRNSTARKRVIEELTSLAGIFSARAGE